MMKKFTLDKVLRLSGWLAGVFLLSLLLAACAGESATATPPPATTAAASASVPAASAAPGEPSATLASVPAVTPTGTPGSPAVIDPNLKTELVIWAALSGQPAAALKDQVAAFGQAYPGVKVSLQEYDPAELPYLVEDAARDHKLPDLLLASADFAAEFSAVKALQPAGPLFDKTFLDGFAPNALNGSNLAGVQWGLPYTYSGTAVMLYNKKLVPAPPQTWDELGKAVRPLYDAKAKQIGLAVDINEPYLLTALLGAFGGSVLDGQGQPALDTPQMAATLGYIQQLLKDKTVRDESRLQDNQIDYAFRDGRLGVYLGGDWLLGRYASGADDKLDLGVAPLPKVDPTGRYPVPFSHSKTFFIGASAAGDRLKAAKVFLQWLAAPEQQAYILSKARLLPATRAFLDSDAVQKDPVWSGLLRQLDLGQPEPAAPAMPAIWEALRPNLEGAVAGVLTPAGAAKQMQQSALAKAAALTSR